MPLIRLSLLVLANLFAFQSTSGCCVSNCKWGGERVPTTRPHKPQALCGFIRLPTRRRMLTRAHAATWQPACGMHAHKCHLTFKHAGLLCARRDTNRWPGHRQGEPCQKHACAQRGVGCRCRIETAATGLLLQEAGRVCRRGGQRDTRAVRVTRI